MVLCRELRGDMRRVVEQVASLLRSGFGDEDYSRVIGVGVGGDQSRYIDVVAEEHIVKGIQGLGTRAWVVSEERGVWALSSKPEVVFLVDPLDGSLNYVLRIPFASISIAAYPVGASIVEPFYGVVYNIFTGDSIELCDGEVFFNGVKVNSYLGLEEGYNVLSVYTENLEHLEKIKRAFGEGPGSLKIRVMGSASIEASYAALGLIGHFAHLTGKVRNVDIAVALALAHRLGAGLYTDPPLRDMRIDAVERVNKLIIARRESPIWKVVNEL